MTAHQQPQSGEWFYVLDEPARILIADDDPIFREFASVHIATPPAQVETAADGEEAWARLASAPFDIALIDIEMPRLDGFALVERIRASADLSCLPVIMVTGREDIASIDRAYQVGATSFAAKPVNWRMLSHQIRYVLRTSRSECRVRADRDRAEGLLAAKTSAVADLRDEVTPPLSTIIALSEAILRDSASAANDRDRIENIARAAQILQRTFSEMA